MGDIHEAEARKGVMHPAIVYTVFCLVIGIWGMNRKLGFWGYFFASLLLTPFVGIVLVLSADPRKDP